MFLGIRLHSKTSTTCDSGSATLEDTQGWQFETWQTTQELGMRMKYARKPLFFIMWLLYVQLLTGQNGHGLVWAILIHPPGLPIYYDAQNDVHIASAGVRLY